MKMRDEVLKGDIEAIEQIENLLRSEEYNASNPIIDIESIARDIFDFECVECPKLEKIRKSSMTVRRQRLILINPLISEQEKKICIAKQLAHTYYGARSKNSNIDLLARNLLLPKYIFTELKKIRVPESEILSMVGFKNNKYMEKQFNFFKEPENISKPIKNSISKHLKNSMNFLISYLEKEENKNV